MLDEIYIESMIKKRFPLKSKRFSTEIGDDSAICKIKDNQIVVSCDSLVENIHFTRKKFTPEEISSRSLAVAVSDISAMGAIPMFFLNSLFLPRGITKKFVTRLFSGFKKTSKKFKISLIGGNISRSDSLIIDVTVIGELKKNKYKERGKCTNGDFIYVSGNIGDASLGLHILNKKRNNLQNIEERKLVAKYKNPNPKIKLGEFLGQLDYVSSMIDITDGLSIDLSRLINLNKNKLGAKVIWENIPKSKIAIKKPYEKHVEQYVLHGGDDYELMFTVNRKFYQKFERLAKIRKFRIFRIGEVVNGSKIILEMGGKNKILKPAGFIHKF